MFENIKVGADLLAADAIPLRQQPVALDTGHAHSPVKHCQRSRRIWLLTILVLALPDQ